MERKEDETYVEFLARLVGWCENNSNLTDDFNNMEAILDFYDLIDKKLGIIDACYLQGYLEDNPGKFDSHYNEFIDKHKLPWRKCFNGEFQAEYAH
jgi:hypothetical protein